MNAEPSPAPLIDRGALEKALRGDVRAVKAFRDALKVANDQLGERFRRNETIETLVADRARVVDEVILASWLHFGEAVLESADLVAVGGYGRGELHPQSDIDLLILLESASNKTDNAIGRFLTFLWDIGLEVGHSVRTLDDCEAQARGDVTVLTTLMETRLLHGRGKLFAELPARIGKDRMWDSAEFFNAKLEEQRARHARYHDTAYNLEPNVKGSPGGLRDIQMISWLARRHFGANGLEDLVAHSFLTPGQLRILTAGQAFLWRIRFGLHLLTG
ncbi:MAG: [protein-PII] uridylyltransferase, partial [Lysobacterales bacterium]